MPIPDDAATELETIRLGIRPQYLHVEEGEHRFAVIVEVIESLGTESVIHGMIADGTRVDILTANAGESVG